MNLIRELEILHKLHHRAIVKYYGINFHSFNDPSKLEPTILTEYLRNGSLKEILDKEKKSIANQNWTATKKYICLLGIADAMRYLHEHQIIHRDLKPQNILIDSEFYPRVCDFGLSRCFSETFSKSMQLFMTGKVGTSLYMAPELYDDDDIQQYGPSVDVYAFAILAYEVVTGLEPFSENGKPISLLKLSRKLTTGCRPEFNKGVTSKMKKLISSCWSDDPKHRPSFKDIFDELSNDFSYFSESIDEDEVNGYIEDLKESWKDEKKTKSNCNIVINNNVILSDLLVDESEINLDEKISEGPFGSVYMTTFRPEGSPQETTFVANCMKIYSYRSLKMFYKQIEIQASLKHDAILPIVGFSTPFKDYKSDFYIITPYNKNETLDVMIRKISRGRSPSEWNETAKAINIFGITAGLAYLHQHNIIHGDLKPQNICLDDSCHPKITGFNLLINNRQELNIDQPNVGTPLYVAPEAFEDENITNKIDVYSYSLVLYELFTYQKPYNNFKSFGLKIINYIVKGGRPIIQPGEIPEIFVKLIKRCWDPDPDERPSFIEIVKDFCDHKADYFDFSIIEEDLFEDYVNEVIKDLNFDL